MPNDINTILGGIAPRAGQCLASKGKKTAIQRQPASVEQALGHTAIKRTQRLLAPRAQAVRPDPIVQHPGYSMKTRPHASVSARAARHISSHQRQTCAPHQRRASWWRADHSHVHWPKAHLAKADQFPNCHKPQDRAGPPNAHASAVTGSLDDPDHLVSGRYQSRWQRSRAMAMHIGPPARRCESAPQDGSHRQAPDRQILRRQCGRVSVRQYATALAPTIQQPPPVHPPIRQGISRHPMRPCTPYQHW